MTLIGIMQIFLIPSIVKDILEEKNELPDSNIFSVSIQVLVKKGQQNVSLLKSEASPTVKSLLTVILALITLPTIILTLIIAPIAWVVSLSIEYFFPPTEPTEEEKKLAATLTEVVSNLRKPEKIKGILKKPSKYPEIGPQNEALNKDPRKRVEKTPLEEESELKKNTQANTTTTKLGKRELISQLNKDLQLNKEKGIEQQATAAESLHPSQYQESTPAKPKKEGSFAKGPMGNSPNL